MEMNEILAVSGQPGLFKFVARSQRGFIVESLLSGKRTNIAADSRVSAMSDISIFTDNEDRPLVEVFEAMRKVCDSKTTISHKESDEAVEAKFAEAVPDYSRGRVHLSDMRKVIAWYNILIEAGVAEFKLPEDEE
ncbi:MAG: DUF5606 domain-containing protein [Rikenellaceae bacterium]|nr:DUF5606 domain-containing protein [Rikenellaceae bacterium]